MPESWRLLILLSADLEAVCNARCSLSYRSTSHRKPSNNIRLLVAPLGFEFDQNNVVALLPRHMLKVWSLLTYILSGLKAV
jgi:hypothetical protein